MGLGSYFFIFALSFVGAALGNIAAGKYFAHTLAIDVGAAIKGANPPAESVPAAVIDALDAQFGEVKGWQSKVNDKLDALYRLMTRNGRDHIAAVLHAGPDQPTLIGGTPVDPAPRMVVGAHKVTKSGEGIVPGPGVIQLTPGAAALENNAAKLKGLVGDSTAKPEVTPKPKSKAKAKKGGVK